jgi:hypothetical protein
MPRLHKYRDRNACYVLTAIRGAVVTFQLTAEGAKKLMPPVSAPTNNSPAPSCSISTARAMPSPVAALRPASR